MNKDYLKLAVCASAFIALGAYATITQIQRDKSPAPVVAAAPVEAPVKPYVAPTHAFDYETLPAAELTDQELKRKVAPDAIDTFPEDAFPKLYAKLGKAEIKRAHAGLLATTYRIASDSFCDRVEMVSLSADRSEKGQLVFWGLCNNGQKWHFTEAELKDVNGQWFNQSNARYASLVLKTK